MEFKHAFHVFVDNFSTTYKLLLYRLIVLAVVIGLSCAVIIPTLNNILSTAQYEHLSKAFIELWEDVIALNLENLNERLKAVSEALVSFRHLISDKSVLVGIAIACECLVLFIYSFLVGVGDYVTGALIHDKMAMHARSSFTITLFKNLKKILLYSIIYAPVTFAYNFVCFVIMWAVVSVGLKGATAVLIKIFLLGVLYIVFAAVKFTFTTDWLPALIRGKMKNGEAFFYTFSRKGKHTGTVFSNALVIILITVALNIAAVLFTFGAGLLITLPATCLIAISFNFVNYFDANKMKYFVDEYTVIGPKKETPTTLEEFFKGDE